jgi:predicted Zn-dependent protease
LSDLGFSEIQQAITADDQSAVLNGGKWETESVTWSLAMPAGTTPAESTAYEAAAQQAFSTWSMATGLQFQEVSNSSQADIELGWGNLDTQETGLVGLTNDSILNGQMQPGVTITLENPSQDTLSAGAGGNLTYAGTEATLMQVMEHEIGHALGFADTDNPTSIMSYYLGSENSTLSDMDIAAARTLYDYSGPDHSGTSSSEAIQLSAQWQKLAQAAASFGTKHPFAAGTSGTGIFVPSQHHEMTLTAGHA